MGQRLNVELISKGKPIANAYMHWSAYTPSSIEITYDVIDAFKNIKEEDLENRKEIYERFKRALPDSSITSDELKEMKKQGIKGFTSKDVASSISRNDGLISFSEKGMEDTRSWEEGRVEVDIENKTVCFDVFWSWDYNDEDEFDANNSFIVFMNEDENLYDWQTYDKFYQITSLFRKLNYEMEIDDGINQLGFII